MKRGQNVRVYLEDISHAISQINAYVIDGKKVFLGDEKTQDAVIRNLAIIGEAVKKLPDNVTNHYPKIPWKAIAGMRDILVHDYAETDMRAVWKTVQEDLPALMDAMMFLLKEPSMFSESHIRHLKKSIQEVKEGKTIRMKF